MFTLQEKLAGYFILFLLWVAHFFLGVKNPIDKYLMSSLYPQNNVAKVRISIAYGKISEDHMGGGGDLRGGGGTNSNKKEHVTLYKISSRHF